MATKNLIPVDAYIRVSRVGGREGGKFLSPDLQRESIKRVCQRDGLRVVTEYEELDASGGDNKRPKWLEAIQRVEDGQSRGIVVWNLARFSRSTLDALSAIGRIENAGGKVYTEEGPDLGKLDRGFRLLIAEDERDRAKASFKHSITNALARGIYIAARIPFGYTKESETRRLNIDPVKALIVVELFERRARGSSWSQLSKWANETHGLALAKTTLSGMLSNPAYLGHARQGELVNERAHEPVVSKLLFDKAAKAKGRKPARTGKSAALLLRGIVECGNCGHKLLVGNTQGAMQKNGKREKLSGYYCRNAFCEHHAYGAGAKADAWVTGRVLSFLKFGNARMSDDKTADAQERARAQKELEEADYQLSTFLGNRRAIITLGVDAWNELLEEYVVARDSAQMTLDAMNAEEGPDFNEVPQLWEQWTDESRREFLGKIIRLCAIEPNTRGRRIPVVERIDLSVSLTGSAVEMKLKGFADGPGFRDTTEIVILGHTPGYDKHGRKLKPT